jgi:hypothetical protein
MRMAEQKSDTEHFQLVQGFCPDWSQSEIRQFVHDQFPDESHIYKLLHSDQWHSRWGAWRRRNPEIVPRLTGAKLQNQSLQDVALRHARLGGAHFSHSDLYNADLSHSYCEYADFQNTRLFGAALFKGDFSYASFNNCDCSHADLREANLYRAAFYNTNLLEADLRGANIDGAVFKESNFSKADLSGLDFRAGELQNCLLIGTNLTNANLSGAHIYGISAWDVKLKGAVQRDLIITPDNAPEISVDNLEVAQFIYLLLNNQRIRHVIDTITSKVVLILGRFTPDRKVILDAIRDELRKRDYLPVLFDFEKPSNRDITETVLTLAHMAKFVIADITDAKSIPQELMTIVPALPSVPVQPLLLASQQEYGMFEHFKRFPWMLEPFLYEGQDQLLGSLDSHVVGPAEKKAREQSGK